MAEPESPVSLLYLLGMAASSGGAFVAKHFWDRRKAEREKPENSFKTDIAEIKLTLIGLAKGQNEQAVEIAGIKASMVKMEDLFEVAENIGIKTDKGFENINAKIDLTVSGIHTRINGLQTQFNHHMNAHAKGEFR